MNKRGCSASRWLVLFVPLVILAGSLATAREVGPGYDIDMSQMIPVRDGIALEGWITKPSKLQGKVPTVLTLTQYDIDGGRHGDSAGYYARRGYAFVQVYVRGRGRSGGVKSDSLGEQVGLDGYDLVEWIARQPWSDGRIVMFGGSFVGMTQWQTAAQLPPHLAAIAPYVPIYPGWDIPNTNGIPEAWTAVILGYVSGRSLNSGFIRNQDYWEGKMLEQYAAYRPFYELDKAIGIAADDWWMLDAQGKKKSMFDVWLDHLGNAAFNLAAEPKAASYARMNFPVLTVTGYYDDDQPGALHYYRNYVAHAPAAAVAQHHLVIGPWDHAGSQDPVKAIEGVAIPEAAIIDMQKLHADWYDFALGRGPRPALLRDTVAYFMLGADEWRYAKSLEAASSGKEMTFFLADSAGTPQDLFHSGQLAVKAHESEPPAIIISDPHELPELAVAKYAADEDLTSQFRAFQKRAITFHSDPFPQDTEIAGHIRLTLECSADAPDFDLWAQLLMVRTDGSSVRLGEDIRRARFRDSQFKQELIKPGQVVQIPFEFKWLARRIPAGARLRLTIAPLNSPNYQKNFNTGGRMGYEKIEDARIANIKIFHDAKRASRLSLPLAASAAAGGI
ncbi:MAG TPA: CocE/NonD family hydrolase [Steroidobacteraceae bacterium]|nr:CocE/NonD family hydrolase [Steroidobacteraceae bacterium]